MRKAMLFLLTLLTLPAYAFELKPFTASYTADWKQMPISGNASRSLKALGDGRWQLDFEASMLLASLNEVSTFKVENDTFLPQPTASPARVWAKVSRSSWTSTGRRSRCSAATAAMRCGNP